MNEPAEDARKKRRHRNERIVAAIVVLLAAAVTAGVVWLEKRERDAERHDLRYIPRPEAITPEIEMLREYVRIDTTSPPGIGRGAQWLASELRKRGVQAELIESAPGYLNVYARIKGLNPGGALLLFNHIDVVPAREGWSQPPFEGKIVFNELYGRGAQDMKSIALCQLLAFARVARSGRPPEHDLVFLATAEEESGSANGIRWLLEHRPDIFEGVAWGVTEGGLAETMGEKIVYFGVEVGGKQLVRLKLVAGDGEALRRARFRLQRFVAYRTADRVLPAVRQYFREIAPTRASFGPYLRDIDATIARGQFWRLPESYREFVQQTMRVNAPYRDGERWSMDVFMVNLPDTDPAERIEWLAREVAPHGVTIGEVVTRQGPVPLSPHDTPLFRVLAGQARRQYATAAGTLVLYRSVTDCRFLRVRGVACYGIAPYPVTIFQATSVHGIDERVRLDWYRQGIEYFDAVVTAWAWPARQ